MYFYYKIYPLHTHNSLTPPPPQIYTHTHTHTHTHTAVLLHSYPADAVPSVQENRVGRV